MYWSARISQQYRALAREEGRAFVWFWIGKHDEYMRRIPIWHLIYLELVL